jgi:hypothetical protein
MKKFYAIVTLSMLLIFGFNLHASANSSQSNMVDFEQNINDFLQNKDKAFKLNELINDPILLQDVMFFVSSDRPDSEITWNLLNEISALDYRNFFVSPGIADILGLKIFNNTALYGFYLDGGNISSIDLSGFKELRAIRIMNTPIKTLDLTNNPKLHWIMIKNTNLSDIHFNGQEMRVIDLIDNNLTKLTFLNSVTFGYEAFLNVSNNYVDIHSATNKPIHEHLLNILGEAVYHAEGRFGYSYLDQKIKTIKIGNQDVNLRAGEPVALEGTQSSIIFPFDIPDGTSFDVVYLPNDDAAALTQGKNFTVAGGIFNFTLNTPEGTSVDNPFTLILNYDKDRYSKNEVAVYYYNELSGNWELIGGDVDEEAGTVTVQVDHFSIYGVLAQTDKEKEAIPGNGSTDDTHKEDESKNAVGGDNSNDSSDDQREVGTSPEAEDRHSVEMEKLPQTSNNIVILTTLALLIICSGAILLWGQRRNRFN